MNTERSVSIECAKCGKPHPHCKAHNRSGEPCGRNPKPHMRVCGLHGGESPRALQAAAKREADSIVTETYDADPASILAAQGLEPVRNPLLELSKLAAEAVHWKEALGARVNALNELRFTDAKGTEQLASEVALYERALDRTARFLDLLVKSGFEERRLRIDEQTGAAFTQVMRAVLDRLDLTPAQREIVPGIVVEELGKLEA